MLAVHSWFTRVRARLSLRLPRVVRVKRAYLLAAGLMPLVAAAAAVTPAATHPAAATIGPLNSPIKHVIEIMIENHTDYYALPTSILSGTIWDQIIPDSDTSDLTTGDQFFTDVANGTLPDFSFVRPRGAVVRQRIRHPDADGHHQPVREEGRLPPADDQRVSVKFAIAGYYRIKATGPDGSLGWVTVDVGVNPNTAP
jgi:hypothetical protein